MQVSILDEGIDRVRAKVLGDRPDTAFVMVRMDKIVSQIDEVNWYEGVAQLMIGVNTAREIAKAVEAYDQGVTHDEEAMHVRTTGNDAVTVRFD